MNPKKTIKNIIKEELDDMQWIIDTEPLSISNKNWIIHNDVNNSEDEERRLQEWIYSQGYVWSNEFNIEDMLDGDCEYYINVNEVYFDAYRGWNDELGNMISYDGYELFNWSSIKKQLNINESEEEVDDFNDDLNWIRETNINPWFDYNYILIDVTPTEENIELLINLALGSGLISKRSLESWSEDLDNDISQIINYFYEYDKSYLRISDEGNLMYGYEVEHSDSWTKYSKIFQENINESEEEDDWAWTKGDPTLGELFDSGLIHEGDKIWVKGYTKVNVHSDKIYLDGWFIITNVGGSFASTGYLTSNEVCDILQCDNSGNFIDEDKNLFVYKIERKSLTESEEEKDPFNWINEIPAGIELQPDTLYYFEPKLTWGELPNFADRIINSEFIKDWLFRRLTGRFTNEQEGIKYFVTSNTVNNIDGWCTEASPYDDWARIIYRGKDYVNARETFYL
jgi:hypothetical protein